MIVYLREITECLPLDLGDKIDDLSPGGLSMKRL